MVRRLVPFVCGLSVLFCALQLHAANPLFRIDETLTRVSLGRQSTHVSLATENSSGRDFGAHVSLELLDTLGQPRARVEGREKIESGAGRLEVEMPTSLLGGSDDERIAWFRLRYVVTPDEGAGVAERAEGVVSLSEITPGLFELQVSSPPHAVEGMRYRARVQATHPPSQRPAKGVRLVGEIELESEDDDDDDAKKPAPIRATATTDADGYAALDFDLPRKTTADELDIRITGQLGDFTQVASDNVSFEREGHFILSTDKPIYQPGQTLHARVLLLDLLARRALADREATLEVRDPQENVVFRQQVRSSRFGVASLDWAIPDNIRLGDYRIELEVEGEDYEDSSARQYFRISRYELPNFAVNVKPDRTYYLPGQNAEVEIRADYLFGQPVTRGHVRVVREMERRWSYTAQKWETQERETYEGETDATGRFTAHIDLAATHNELSTSDESTRFRDLTYAAYFTDPTTNRTEQRRFDLRVTRESIHVYVISHFYDQTINFPLQFYVTTYYADGSPAPCNVEMKLAPESAVEIASQTRGLPATRPPEFAAGIPATFKTNNYGLAKVDGVVLRPATEGNVPFIFTARDAEGRTGHASQSLYMSNREMIRVDTDKALYRAGQPIRAQLISTLPDAPLAIDINSRGRLIRSQVARLKNGKADLRIPFTKEFRGEVTIVAYALYAYGEQSSLYGARSVLYPHEDGLKFDVHLDRREYKPGEEASAEVRVRTAEGREVESVLGVVVADRAVEERARTDREFGASAGGFDADIREALGEAQAVSGVTRRSLNRIKLSPAPPEGMELVADLLLNRSHDFDLNAFGDGFSKDQERIFSTENERRLKPVRDALNRHYAQHREYPANDASLRRILGAEGIDFDALRDPWGSPYLARFNTETNRDKLSFISISADKRADTTDDFTAAALTWEYFLPTGEAINSALKDFHERTGAFIHDDAALADELQRRRIDLTALRDPWGSPYRVGFGIYGREIWLVIVSAGPDRRFSEEKRFSPDDFNIWTTRTAYFADAERRINALLSGNIRSNQSFPANEEELRALLIRAGLDPARTLRDPWGHDYRLSFNEASLSGERRMIPAPAAGREPDAPRDERQNIPLRLHNITVRSDGADAAPNTADDIHIAAFNFVVEDKTTVSAAGLKTRPAPNVVVTTGLLSGTVVDPNDAAIPGVNILAVNKANYVRYETATDDEGRFLLADLPPGTYEVRMFAPGFKQSVITDLSIEVSRVAEITARLEVGAVSEAVEVTSNSFTVDTSTTQVGEVEMLRVDSPGRRSSLLTLQPGMVAAATDSSAAQISTPRLREYFPETLVWQPSVETDANGHAHIRFKLADNITTWKMTIVGSTLDGELGLAEADVRAFKPFFIEHDPPRVLTEGDEISLPVVLRNYLSQAQAVSLDLKAEDWFTMLGPAQKRTEVAAGDARRETFDFRAARTVTVGRQRITAIAADDSDAIEKTVSVHPDGREISETSSTVFRERGSLDVSLPADTVPGTARLELKIYPGLSSHVIDGVEGIMRRPYGCGEQTISSTYPSLLVLRHYNDANAKQETGGGAPASSNVTRTARRYLQAGYERLLGYQQASGGFAYWKNDEPDLALTAYALRFLNDARGLVAVDEEAVARARNWLVQQQRPDGSWVVLQGGEVERVRTDALTAYVAHILAAESAQQTGAAATTENGGKPPAETNAAALKRAQRFLSSRLEGSEDAYMLAAYALLSASLRDDASTSRATGRLAALKREEGSQVYWDAKAATPFHGWGLTGRIETTALVTRALALAPVDEAAHEKTDAGALAKRALVYLLRHKDPYGVWYSTQATVSVLDALIAVSMKRSGAGAGSAQSAPGQEDDAAHIFVDGQRATTVSLPGLRQPSAPVVVELSRFVNAPGPHHIEIQSNGVDEAAAHAVTTYYVPWTSATASAVSKAEAKAAPRLSVGFDQTEAQAGANVTCHVEIGRSPAGGYGMLLGEIGLPPGVEVDRATLEQALKSPEANLSSYEVLPDRVIVYVHPWYGQSAKFDFKFRPRYPVRALSAPSEVYDYYNPESRVVVAPTKFVIR